jgi:hypothetical protein
LLESTLKEKDEEILKLNAQIKRTVMEKDLARSLMEKLQSKLAEDIETAKK